MTSSPPRILVADDDRAFLDAITIFLKGNGFDVLTALDATLAIRHCRKEPIDLMVLDIDMPAGGGPFVIGRIRDLPKTATLPVIVSTGNTSDNLEEYSKNLGANDFIRKPYDLEELLEKIKAALGKNPDTSAPA